MAAATMQQAVGLQEAGQLAGAAALFQEILRENPAHFGALYSLGVVYLQLGQIEPAAMVLANATGLNPRFPNAWYARGQVLLRLGRWQDALDCLDQTVALQPDFIDAMALRVAPLKALNRLQEALLTADRVLAMRPESADDWNARGLILFAMVRLEDALESIERAIALVPDFTEALANRATVLLEMRRLEDALAAFDAVVAADPNHAVAWNNRGNVLLAMKRFEEAIADYDKALAIRPDFALAMSNRGHAQLGLGQATRCPPLFVRRMFDEVSAEFEQKMSNLGYRAHLELRLLASQVLSPEAEHLRILDLGSGTGLAGDAFKDLAEGGRLDGIELSPGMNEEARKRGIYNRLILGDIESVLAAQMPSYDLVLAADTIIYLGDLSACFQGVSRCLATKGFFIFSVEKKDGEGWEQTNSNRFRHSESYLREEATRAGLTFARLQECTPRYEARRPVAGLAMAFTKT
jgi:predicted TPR repeat methyltransferase